MKFLLLKALSISRGKDQGFTLPLVIGIGFVMVLLSTVSLVQSGEENLNALSQQGSSDSLAMAEVGVARYRNLLNNNRALAVNDIANWAGLNNQTCDQILANANGLADTAATAWKDVSVNGAPVIGSYRIVDYEYDRDGLVGAADLTDDSGMFSQLRDNGDLNGDGIVEDSDGDGIVDVPDEGFDAAIGINGSGNHNDTSDDGNTDARGLLTIQGKDTAGTSTDGANIVQVQVEIPLGVNTSDLDDLNPALWIGQSAVGNLGTLNTNGANLVYKQPSTGGASGCTVTGTNIISDARDLPPLADLTGVTQRALATGNISANNANTDINNFNGGEIILGSLLDDATALDTGVVGDLDDDRYYYNVPGSLDLTSGQAIIADGTSKVILFVDGDLDIVTGGAAVRLINSSHVSETGATTPDDVDRYLEIHVTGDVNISGTGDLDITGLLRVGGTVNINSNAQVDVTGAIWANDWSNSFSGAVDIETDDYRFYSITPNRTPAPLTYRPSRWETQEAS